jgi:hypothetical protein
VNSRQLSGTAEHEGGRLPPPPSRLTHSGRAAAMRCRRCAFLESNASASDRFASTGAMANIGQRLLKSITLLASLSSQSSRLAAAIDKASRQNLVDAASIEIDNLELPTKRIESFTDAW